ncbi:MAG TPA: DUF6544 family protein [Anaeromyxobacteraceae bacterium]|nr:DUF6544 family protein [Anaeromyxobacteraceae bacterium]
MLLDPNVSWAAVDDQAFDLALSDRGRTVEARVLVDPAGAVRDLRTDERVYYRARDRTTVRTRPVSEWVDVDGVKVPGRGQAVWHPPEGTLPYADFRVVPGSLRRNVAPGE